MKTAKYVKVVIVQDPDTNGIVQLEVYKHQNGGMFAMDSSYLEQVCEDDDPTIPDPFATKFSKLVLKGGMES
jgi:hypothetical protein